MYVEIWDGGYVLSSVEDMTAIHGRQSSKGKTFLPSWYSKSDIPERNQRFVTRLLQALFWLHANDQIDVTLLLGDDNYYRRYFVLGNLMVITDGVSVTSSYNKSLDLGSGLHTTSYTANDENWYTTALCCSYLHQVCVYNISSSAALPQITTSLENLLMDSSLLSSTCGDGFVT